LSANSSTVGRLALSGFPDGLQAANVEESNMRAIFFMVNFLWEIV
jgi:hypothetical protein